jgi:prepilin-type processing-associated H-X9-DG protein
MISPYIKAIGVFQCPDNPQKSVADLSPLDNPTAGVLSFPVSYSAARYDNGSGGAFNAQNPVKLAQIQTPASTIDIVESTIGFSEFLVNGNGSGCFENNTGDTSCFGGAQYSGSLFAGHTSFSNFLFCDGHVKAMKPLATVDIAEGGAGTTNMWTVDNSAFAAGDAAGVTGSGGTLTFAANKYK